MKKPYYKTMIMLFVLLCFILGALTSGCTGNPNSDTTPQPTIPTVEQIDLKTYNEFAIELLRNSYVEGQNQLINPVAIGMALSMLHTGAGPDTAKGIEEALNLHFVDSNSIANSCYIILQRLNSLKQSHFSSDTALYIGEGLSVKEQMAQQMEQHFDLSIDFVDFGSTPALLGINDWIDTSSFGRINAPYDEDSFTEDMTMLLINVSTLDGTWQTGFNKDNTRSIPFEIKKGKGVAAPTMRGKVRMKLYEGEDAVAGYIPLSDGQTTIAVLVPPADMTLDEFLEPLDAQSILLWQSIAYEGEQWILLPKIDIERNTSLKELLSDMGAQDVFIKESADFTPMGTNIYLGDIMQAIRFRADEDGVAPIEVSNIDLTRAINKKEHFFSATRPFIYALIDDETGGLLMVGILSNPLGD